MNSSVSVRSRGYLPHWESEAAVYFVTFRLADSLPREVAARLRHERLALQRICSAGFQPAVADKDRLWKLNALLKKAEQYLDSGLGACHMRDPRIANIVVAALRQFNGHRYDRFAWCVMPNHVHVLFSPRASYRLESILHSWKSYSANQSNRILRRGGPFWQREYFDHLVRSQSHLLKFARYIEQNPTKAGLHHWPWVSSRSAGFPPASFL